MAGCFVTSNGADAAALGSDTGLNINVNLDFDA